MVKYNKKNGRSLTRPVLKRVFGTPAVRRSDEECWKLDAYVLNTLCGCGWRLRWPFELTMFNTEHSCEHLWQSWWDERPCGESWVVVEKQNEISMWAWFTHGLRVTPWTPTAAG